jgi:hypothetical protein
MKSVRIAHDICAVRQTYMPHLQNACYEVVSSIKVMSIPSSKSLYLHPQDINQATLQIQTL